MRDAIEAAFLQVRIQREPRGLPSRRLHALLSDVVRKHPPGPCDRHGFAALRLEVT